MNGLSIFPPPSDVNATCCFANPRYLLFLRIFAWFNWKPDRSNVVRDIIDVSPGSRSYGIQYQISASKRGGGAHPFPSYTGMHRTQVIQPGDS